MPGAMRKPHFDTAKSANPRNSAKPAPVATLGSSQSLVRKADVAESTPSPRRPSAGTPPRAVKSRRRKLFFAASLALLTAGGGTYGYFDAWPKYMCRQWEVRALAAADAEAEAAVERVAGCGSPGTIALTRLLACERPAVAKAARDRLAAICRNIRDTAASDRPLEPAEVASLEALAAGMDELVETYRREVPPEVADFSWDVLEMTGRMKLVERVPMLVRGRLATASDTLLQRPTRPRSENVTVAQPKTPAPQPPIDAATQQRLDARKALASLYNLPTTPAATAETAPAGLPTAMPAAPLAASEPKQPTSGGLSSGIASSPLAPRTSPETQSTANAAARINPIRDEAAASNIRQVSTAPPRLDVDTPANSSAAPNAALQRHLTTRSAWALLGDLQSPGTPQASAAAAELHRRGFSLREIEIGKHLTSPDAAERMKYTEQLPSSGIAVKPWLLYLSSDPDAEVRRAAVAIMATSNDPELKAKLRELAITDADGIVREQAAKSGRSTMMRMPGGR